MPGENKGAERTIHVPEDHCENTDQFDVVYPVNVFFQIILLVKP
jgi:hypothetical protein